MHVVFSLTLIGSVIFLSSCKQISIENIKKDASSFVNSMKVSVAEGTSPGLKDEKNYGISSLKFSELLESPSPDVNLDGGFVSAVKSAIEIDPKIAVAKEALASEVIGIDIAEAAKEFSVTGTLYGGVEDITDEVSGAAFTLSVRRAMFDGGQLDGKIAKAKYSAETAKHTFRVKMDERALELSSLWVDLELYQSLQQQIDSRLAVLDPLIVQLEKVAAAGIGNASKVASAQRTVFAIRAKKSICI
jgi:outer membrane protein TolC